MRLLIVCAFFVICSGAVAQTSSISDFAALRQTLESSNLGLKEMDSKVEELEAQKSEALRLLVPQFSFRSTAATAKDRLLSGTPLFGGEQYNIYSQEFGASWTLLKGGAIWSKLQLFGAQAKLLEIERNILKRDLNLQLISIGFSISVLQEKLKVYERLLAAQEKMIGISRVREIRGNDPKSTRLQFEVLAEKTKALTENTQNLIQKKGLELAEILNFSGEKIDIPKLQINYTKVEAIGTEFLGELEKPQSRAQTLELKRAQVQRDSQSYLTQIEVAEHWPSLSLAGAWGSSTNRFSDSFRSDAFGWKVGLELTLPLFSGLSSFADRKVQAEKETQTRINFEAVRLRDQRQLSQRYEDLKSILRLIKIEQKNRKMSSVAFEESTKDYSRGFIPFTSVFESQRGLLDSEIQFLETSQRLIDVLIEIKKLRDENWEILLAAFGF